VPAKISAGAAVDFDASDSFDEDGDPLTFSWDFGDGGQFQAETPSHIFIEPGNYQVKLTVSDGQESSTLAKTIRVGGTASLNDESDEIAVSDPPLTALKKIGNEKAVQKIVAARTAGQKTPLAPAAKKITPAAAANRADKPIGDYRVGTSLKRSGQVVVLPGSFGSQFFYLLSASNSPAIKIYNYKKDFPPLKIGDLISAAGIVGGPAGDEYLKIKNAAAVKISGVGAPPLPEKITAAEFTADNLGKFVQAEGEIEAKSGQLVKLFDGQADFDLYLKSSANVSASNFKAGQKIIATGLLAEVSGELALLPRNQADLAAASSSPVSGTDAEGQILGAATGSSAWTLPAQGNDSRPLVYILIAAGGIFILAAVFFAKKYFFAKPK
jgi:PKD repeat protein